MNTKAKKKAHALYMRNYRKNNPALAKYMRLYLRKYMRTYRRLCMIKLRLEFGGKCKTCETTSDLQFAHITPTGLSGAGRGKLTRILDIKKHRKCYTLLCVTCHREFDKHRKERK